MPHSWFGTAEFGKVSAWNQKCVVRVCVCVCVKVRSWLCVFVSHSKSLHIVLICPNLNQKNTLHGGEAASEKLHSDAPSPSDNNSPSFSLSLPSLFLCALADGLDGALEAGGCLQLELVGHGVDLKSVQPGEKRYKGKTT